MRKKQFFFVFFQNFFEFWAKFFSDFRPKNFKKISKLPTCPEEKFVSWNFFLKFWIVLDFLQKPSAWFSNFYLRVQSKNCGKNSFFLFFFSNFFRILSEKFFRLSAEKLQEVVKTTFCVSRGTVCDFNFFKKSFELFWIFCRNLWHGSQTSIFVSRVKIAEKTVFFVFFQNFFEFWAKTFQTLGQKTSKIFQNYLRVQRKSLWLENFF